MVAWLGALSKYNTKLFQIRDLCAYDLDALRMDAENKRHALTALRIEVSEGPTVRRSKQLLCMSKVFPLQSLATCGASFSLASMLH